jgi:quercetin dioxygenase-like cupin family protein
LGKRLALVSVLIALASIASVAYAQYGPPPSFSPAPTAAPNPINRQVLNTVNFPADPWVTIQTYTTIAAGATAPNHTHPGIEVTYVLDGTADLFVAGQPTRHLKAGDSFVIPAGVVHGARVTSSVPLKLVTTYVVDKTKPLATAAAQ